MGRSLERLLTKTRRALKTISRRPIKGKDLRCPKCGYLPLAWSKGERVAPNLWPFTFLCFRCHSRDTVEAYSVIDAYCRMVDRFYESKKPKQKVILKEDMQPLQKQL